MAGDAQDPARAISERSASKRVRKQRRGPGRQFAKGVSGNPKGRPPVSGVIHGFLDTVVTVARGKGHAQIERRQQALAALFAKATTDNRDQIKALELLLAYDFGRPRERVEMSGPKGKPIATEDVTEAHGQTTGEMRKRIAALLKRRDERLAAKGDVPPKPTNGHSPEGS